MKPPKPMTNTLKMTMDEMLPLLEQELKDVLAETQLRSPAPFYQMLHYHMGWVDETFTPMDANGGKRIRPVLCLLCTAAANGTWQAAVPAAAAIELLHNFTLIHDDIQDSSPTRRGRPTIWKLWGVPLAINAGDAMFSLAHDALYRLEEKGAPSQTIVHAARRFDETCLDLTIGQYRDMNFEMKWDVSVADYLQMIGGKTAALLALCGELGSLIAGAEQAIVDHYADFARNLGVAFQIKDDILGIWGDEDEIGKSAATDIITRKKTLPVLYGLERNAELRDLYQTETNDPQFVTRVATLLDESGALEFAQAEATRYSQAALDHLSEAKPEGRAADSLHELVGLLLSRNY